GKGAAKDYDVWISCSHCQDWYHCICIQLENPQDYDQWYCEVCIRDPSASSSSSSSSSAPSSKARTRPAFTKPLSNVPRPEPRKSKRIKTVIDYAAVQSGMPADPIGRWYALLETRSFLPDRFRRMEGKQWSVEWLVNDPEALSEPVIVPRSSSRQEGQDEGKKGKERGRGADEDESDRARRGSARRRTLRPRKTSIPGMKVPPSHIKVSDIASILGEDHPVEVIDVASQTSSKSSWSLGEWCEYFETDQDERRKVLNVISLEVSGTEMERLVEAPKLVSEMDWTTRDWPADRRGRSARENSWPKVLRYVLMGVKGAYSDWHIDFAASGVYYHVVWGRKVFLFAPPTPANLSSYRSWCSSTRQDHEWLGDSLKGLTKVEIGEGETMLIPGGWLHSVYTPEDTLVVGGNFLTDWNVATQLRVAEIEEQTKVPKKFRYPHLKRLSWYVASGWADRLKVDRSCEEGEPPSPPPPPPPLKVLRGLSMLVRTLQDDVELMEDETVKDEKGLREVKLAKEAIPS
ncbi:Clavaminate synthase-like protein, partial [Violaceomyces palustris]